MGRSVRFVLVFTQHLLGSLYFIVLSNVHPNSIYTTPGSSFNGVCVCSDRRESDGYSRILEGLMLLYFIVL